MLNTFLYAFNAVVPLVLLIFVGYLLRRIGIFSERFISEGYRFSFRIALPCLLFCNVYTIESLGEINLGVVIYGLLGITALFVLGAIAAFLFIPDSRQRGVIVQCFFRSNFAILGSALAAALGGDESLQCVAILAAFSIPLFNSLAVVALSIFHGARGEGTGLRSIRWGSIGRKILTNPLIIGIAIGLFCLAVRALLPLRADGTQVFRLSRDLKFLYATVENISKIASPFMLLMLGGQFTFSATGTMKKQIVVGVVGRVILAPVLCIGGAYLLSRAGVLSVGAPEYVSFIALFASPVAVSSAIMAREMDNDDILAGQLVVWTSISSVLSVFLLAFAFRSFGLI